MPDFLGFPTTYEIAEDWGRAPRWLRWCIGLFLFGVFAFCGWILW